MLHCLEAIEFGMKQEWYIYKKFDLKSYEHYSKKENGNLNWIIPDKLMAFNRPKEKQDP
jgi:hypothetical protein